MDSEKIKSIAPINPFRNRKNTMKIPSIPFKMLALAPFLTENIREDLQRPITADRNNLDQVMANLSLALYVSLPAELCPTGRIDIPIKRIKDFHPDQMLKNNPYLKNLMDAKIFIEKSKSEGVSIKEIGNRIKEWPDLPLIHIEAETPGKEKKSDHASIDNILSLVALPDEPGDSASQKADLSIQIENILEEILQHIFSDEAFIKLESVWRGLNCLLKEAGTGTDVKVEIVNVSPETLNHTMDTLMAGLIDDLPSLVLVDVPFDNSPLSLEHLEKIARFSETLMAPSICWVTHDFFYIENWEAFNRLPFLPNHLTGSHYAKWQKLEQSTHGRWVSVTCNRFLSRYPYGPDNKTRAIRFMEKGHSWLAPVWAVAALMTQSVFKTGWPTPFTDYPEIVLEDMPLNNKNPDKPIPTEIFFANDRVDQLLRIGIIPLSSARKKDIVFASKETTVAGNSLRYQILLSALSRFIFWCLDNFDKGMPPQQIEENFTQAMVLFWEKSGDRLPKDLVISAGCPDPENRIPLRISLTPPHRLLPSGEKIELEFRW